jgi:hypothetical protein
MCKDAIDSGDLTQIIVIWNRPEESPSSSDWKVIEVKGEGVWETR